VPWLVLLRICCKNAQPNIINSRVHQQYEPDIEESLPFNLFKLALRFFNPLWNCCFVDRWSWRWDLVVSLIKFKIGYRTMEMSLEWTENEDQVDYLIITSSDNNRLWASKGTVTVKEKQRRKITIYSQLSRQTRGLNSHNSWVIDHIDDWSVQSWVWWAIDHKIWCTVSSGSNYCD